MILIILILVAGSALVYLSRFNYTPVTVNLIWYTLSDIPLFYVIIGSLLVGLVLSYLVYLINEISTSMTINGKDNEIKKNKNEVLDLTKRVHQLELENEKLKRKANLKSADPNSL